MQLDEMSKVIWGSSQAITSLLSFLIQLSFLKSSNSQQMALFLTLFAVMNFILIAIRRSMIEVNKFNIKVPSIFVFVVISTAFMIFSLPISTLIHSNFLIVACVSLFLFDQLVLDFFRFSRVSGHFLYIGVQVISITVSISLMIANVSAISIILIISLFQLSLCILFYNQDARMKLNINDSRKLVSLTRVLDFAVTSGFGFLVPLITYVLLDANSVGILRTSQNILSLGSVFTSALYYSTLQSENIERISKFTYFVPTFLMMSLLIIITFSVPPLILEQIFGPYFFDSLPLTVLLLLALVPTIWSMRICALLVKLKKYRLIFKIHVQSLVILALGSSAGFYFFGIESFGIFSFFSALYEMLLMIKFLKGIDR